MATTAETPQKATTGLSDSWGQTSTSFPTEVTEIVTPQKAVASPAPPPVSVTPPPPKVVMDVNYKRRKCVGEAAEKEATAIANASKLNPLSEISHWSWEDNIDLHQIIGYGGFSQVYKCTIRNDAPFLAAQKQKMLKEQQQQQQQQANGENADNADSKKQQEGIVAAKPSIAPPDLEKTNDVNKDDNDDEEEEMVFALKCLNPSTMNKTKTFRTGAVDLTLECEILSRVSHPNIIQLYGRSKYNNIEAYLQNERGFFIVLDLLKDTLSNRLDLYRKKHKEQQESLAIQTSLKGSKSSGSLALKRSGLGGMRSSKKATATSKTHTAVLERIQSIAIGVAKGMECLHAHGIVLRDLKPDNVGFDFNGQVKIFDLGFAREVHTLKPKEVAGSLRYMAPEVALATGTQLLSDVYSFGVLLWEICTLDKPYKHIGSREDFMEHIIQNGWRHSTSEASSSSTLKRLIKDCWDTKPSKRPSFTKIVKVLRVELSLLGASNGLGLPSSMKKKKGFGLGSKTSFWQNGKSLVGGNTVSDTSTSTASSGYSSNLPPSGLSSNSLRRMNQWVGGSSNHGGSSGNSTFRSSGSGANSNHASLLGMPSKRMASNASFGVLRSALSRSSLSRSNFSSKGSMDNPSPSAAGGGGGNRGWGKNATFTVPLSGGETSSASSGSLSNPFLSGIGKASKIKRNTSLSSNGSLHSLKE